MKLIVALATGAILGSVLSLPKPEELHRSSRSPKWPEARAAHLAKNPVCEVCGGKEKIEVHHVEPFHERPELELSEENLVTLCADPSCKAHLTIGHLGNYQLHNPKIREDAAMLKIRRQEARKK